MKTELRHYLFKCGLIFIIPIYIVLKIFSLGFTEVYIDTDVARHDELYSEFFGEYSGRATLDKKENLEADGRYTDDTVIARYMDYAMENPNQRYIVCPSGWEAWLGNIRLDFPMVILLIFVICYLFSSDNETGMEPVKRIFYHDDRKFYLYRFISFIVLFISLTAASYICEFLYFDAKYGLSGYLYPVQSLMSYQNSDYNISLILCSIAIMLIKAVGCLLICCISSVFALLIKKIWTSTALASAFVLVPYVFFNHKLIIEHIPYMGMLIANFYIRGGEENINFNLVQIAEPCDRFSAEYLLIMLFVSIMLTAVIFNAAFYIGKSGGLKSNRGVVQYSVVFLAITVFPLFLYESRITVSEDDFTGRYYSNMSYSDEQFAYDYYDCENNYLYRMTDEGKKQPLIRGVFDVQSCVRIYCTSDYIYYLQKDDVSGLYTYYRMDKSDLDSELIYEEYRGTRGYVLTDKYLGIINVDNMEQASLEYQSDTEINDFWVDGKYIFAVDRMGIRIIDYENGDEKTLIDEEIGACVAYENGMLYYIDRYGEVRGINVCTGKQERTGIYGLNSMCMYDGTLYCVDSEGQFFAYCSGVMTDITDGETIIRDTGGISLYQGTLFCAAYEGIFRYDTVSGGYILYKLADDIKAYNVRAYFSDSLYVYAEQDGDYKWIFIHYSD